MRGICLIPNFDIPKYGRGGRPLTKSVSIDHRMIKMSLVRQCVYCMTTTKEKHRTTRQCKECQVPLCFQKRDCFTKWHDRRFAALREAWLAKPPHETRPKGKGGRPKGSSVPRGRGKRKRRNW